METGISGERHVAGRVAANVRQLRERRGLTLDELSQRLGEIGRPILKSGLSKLETGQRRVDVDDLLALAIALETSPNRLLLGEDVEKDDSVNIVGSLTSSTDAAWSWACGQLSEFSGSYPWAWFLDSHHATPGDMRRFQIEARPHDPPILMSPEEWQRTEAFRHRLAALWFEMEEAGLGREHFRALLRAHLGEKGER